MSSQLYNNVTVNLTAAVSPADLTINVSDGSQFPDPSPSGDYIPVYVYPDGGGALEIMHVTAVTGNILTVDRSQEDTDPLTFNGTESVQIRLTRQALIDTPAGDVTTSTGTQTLTEALDSRWIHFATVSDMQAAAGLSVGDRVRTSGYQSSGDGGGNDYEIVAAGTGVEDSGSFIDLSGSGLQARGIFTQGVKAAQFGLVADGVTDSRGAIQAAHDIAKQKGFRYVDMPGGDIAVDTSAGPIRSTDATVIFRAAGMRTTVIKALSACDDIFLFDTETTVGGERIPSGGLDGMSVDGDGLAKRCVKTVSTNYGHFDQLSLRGATEDCFLATTQNGQPSSQHNYYGTVEILFGGSANGFRGTGSQAVGGNGNWSLNYVENIYTLMQNDASGDGFVFGFSDGNYVAHLRNYNPPTATGYAIRFKGDNVGDVTGGAHARLNVIAHCQTDSSGCLAENGTEFESSNRILSYSRGNGSPLPTIQAGATLGFSDRTSNGMKGTFTPTLIGTSGGTPSYVTQKGRYSIGEGRAFVEVEIEISAVNSLSGNIRIGNLPYPMSNTTGTDAGASGSIGRYKTGLGSGYSQLSIEAIQGQTEAQFWRSGDAVSPSTLVSGNLNSDSLFKVTLSYPI